MKKLICQFTKCLFDSYEPVTLYEGKYPIDYAGRETLELPIEISECKFIDIFYEAGGNYGEWSRSHCKRIYVGDFESSLEEGERIYPTGIFELSGIETYKQVAESTDEEGNPIQITTNISDTYSKQFRINGNFLTPSYFYRTRIQSVVDSGENATTEIKELSLNNISLRIYKIIGWK